MVEVVIIIEVKRNKIVCHPYQNSRFLRDMNLPISHLCSLLIDSSYGLNLNIEERVKNQNSLVAQTTHIYSYSAYYL